MKAQINTSLYHIFKANLPYKNISNNSKTYNEPLKIAIPLNLDASITFLQPSLDQPHPSAYD